MTKFKQWGLLLVTAVLLVWTREENSNLEEKITVPRPQLDHRRFETSLTTSQSSLEKSFPLNWKPCTLSKLLEQKNALTLTLLGGSTSARPADNCHPGRYSDILQDSLSLPVTVHNMAQGATNSQWSAISLDELVDPLETDIILWEYQTNDQWARGNPQPHALQLWFARIQALYAQVNRPPPPILLLFLWEGYIADHPETVDWEGGVKEALPFLQDYTKDKDPSWNLQVIGVGAAVHNTTAFVHNPKLLLDDDHHPSCAAAHLIAHLIEHAVQMNLATATKSCRDESNPKPVKGIHDDDHPFHLSEPWVRDVWNLLTSPSIRVGSHTSWQPKLYDRSKLHITNLNDFEYRDVWQGGKADVGRADRKLFYPLPECSTGTSFTILLEEPSLEWLAFGGNKLYLLQLSINTKVVAWRSHPDVANRLGILDLQRWVHAGEDFALAAVYNVSLCQKDQHTTGRKALLNKIVGLMRS